MDDPGFKIAARTNIADRIDPQNVTLLSCVNATGGLHGRNVDMWHALMESVSYLLISKQEAEAYERLDQGRIYACSLNLTRPTTVKEGNCVANPEIWKLYRVMKHVRTSGLTISNTVGTIVTRALICSWNPEQP